MNTFIIDPFLVSVPLLASIFSQASAWFCPKDISFSC